MEAAKRVNWTANALAMVANIFDYFENQSGEHFASAYIDDLLTFGNDLSSKSLHFSYCRNEKLQAKRYRCAVFRKSYVLIYNENISDVFILAVLHVKRGPEIFEQI